MLIAIITTRVKARHSIPIVIYFLSKKIEKIAVQSEKLAMVMQWLERQGTEEVREQEMLNCESMVHNETEDQDTQPINSG